MTKVFSLIALILFAFAVQAEDSVYGSDIPFMANTQIRFLSYDAGTRTYKAISIRHPGEGTAYVTPEGIAKSIRGLTLEQLQRHPESLLMFKSLKVDSDKELPTLTPSERRVRRSQNR